MNNNLPSSACCKLLHHSFQSNYLSSWIYVASQMQSSLRLYARLPGLYAAAHQEFSQELLYPCHSIVRLYKGI